MIGDKVLIVDDDSAIREALVELLCEEGYCAVGACNGVEALGELRRSPLPQLILLDLMMPVMDGWQFMAEQQADPHLSRVPVLVVTADNSAIERPQALRAQGIVRKPFNLDQLLAAISAHAQPGAPQPVAQEHLD
jgi:CheY-like chemotaxis protein